MIEGLGVVGGRPNQIVDLFHLGLEIPFGLRTQFRDAVQLFVDVGDAVLPDLFFPRRGGQLVLEHAAVPVKRGQLAGLFVQGHLPQEIFHPFFDRGGGILVRIHLSVLVQVPEFTRPTLTDDQGQKWENPKHLEKV